MMAQERVAIVTGGNRGIGLEVCRQLARNDMVVILTSRNKEAGQKAAHDLQKEELPVVSHQLDVVHPASIEQLVMFVKKEYGRCDILINNAGILPDTTEGSAGGEFPSVFKAKSETITRAMTTNVYGSLHMCQAFVPMMKKNGYGRIVNISSGMGQLSDMNGGYPAYRLSKTALNALTRILAEELSGENILVNTMCPGWVKTRMGGENATRSVEEGADTAVFLSTLPDNGPSGKFFRDRKEILW